MKTRNLTIVAALLMTGCVIEPEVGPDDHSGALEAPGIVAELAQEPATRTCIDSDTLVPGQDAAVLWMPEDQLGVFSADKGNVLYVNDEKTGNVPNASFSSTASVSGELKHTYYPYDKANDGKDVTALAGVVPAKQTMDAQLPADYKYGVLKGIDENGGYKFKFHNMFSLVRFRIDATGSDLEGKTLEKVTLKVTRDNGAAPALTGDFTFSAVDGSYTLGETSNMLSTLWDQKLEGEISSFATVFPEVKAGDKLTFTFSTGESNVVFTVTSKVDFEPEMYYTFPLKIASFAKNPDKYGYAVKARPTITSFKFEVSKNSGKLLDNKTVWSSSNKPTFSEVKEHEAEISGTSVDVMIPYLYDFTLVPTFTAGGTVTVGSQTVTSGSTAVDFTGTITLTVNTEDEARDYTVNVTNTGLPVVVLKQSGSGDFDEVYQGGYEIFGMQIGGTLVNEFVDFMIRGKETDWVEDDQITVYNADGTVELPTALCGAKLRGNTSQAYPKKPFAIKMAKKQSIFGLPKHKRWVLLANWLDHSMIRNTVALDIAHAIEKAWQGNSSIGQGIPWNVHGKNVELVFVESDGTGHHMGNYFLCEQIKIDEGRLNITSPDGANEGSDYTQYGYLLEVDNNYDEVDQFKTSKGVPFMFKDEVSDAILSSVKTKVQGIETNLYNSNFAAAYNNLDINSVIDQLFIWELTMNREYGDPRSVYMYMDGDGKLSAGPVWDFDRGTFQNTTNAKSQGNSDRVKPYNEWMYWRTAEDEDCSYIWYRQLAKDPTFVATAQERWAVIYPQLQLVSGQIREYGRTMRESFAIDSEMWPTDKSSIQAHKSGFTDWSGDENINDWDELIENFVTVYESRLEGMNTLITSGKFTK